MGLLSSLVGNFLFRRSLPKSVDAIFFGLGNPGDYSKTRHNVGFRVADRLSAELKTRTDGHFFEADIVTGMLCENKGVLVAKPHTFMNRSGFAVKNIVTKWSVPLSATLVIVDDFNIPLGNIRARRGGSHGGHNGLKSIISQVGPDFPRLRIGIGPVPPDTELVSFVLGEFESNEESILNEVFSKAVSACMLFVTDGIDAVMNKFNQ